MATPTLVQRTPSSSGGSTAYTTYVFCFPNATQAGNLLVLCGQYGVNASVTPSVSDDKSQTWTVAKTGTTGDGNQTLFIAYFPNSAAGVKQITITYGGANAAFCDAWAGEFNNCATSSPVDVSTSNTASSNTVQAGSFTPTVSGDLIVMVAEQDSQGAVQGWAAGSQTNITWALADADRGNGSGVGPICQAVQWGVYTSTTALNPQMTKTDSNTGQYNAVAVAFKSASAGAAAPAGVYVSDVNHYNLVSFTSPLTVQNPTSAACNCLILSLISVHGTNISAISDSHSNHWLHIGLVSSSNGSGDIDLWYTDHGSGGSGTTPVCSPDMTVTLTVSAALADADMVIYGVQGLSPSAALDTGFGTSGLAQASGTQTVAGNLTSVSGTPSTANGLIVCTCGVDSPQIRSLTSGNSDTTYSPQEASAGELDENNGKGHYYNPNTSSFTFTWTTGGSALQGWAAAAAAFMASANGDAAVASVRSKTRVEIHF